jgi:hypothetical protein
MQAERQRSNEINQYLPHFVRTKLKQMPKSAIRGNTDLEMTIEYK